MSEEPPMRISEKIKVFTHEMIGALKLEWLIILGLILIIGGIIWAILAASSGTGPKTELNSTVVKELLDILKTLLGGLLTWGTILVNTFAFRIREKKE